MQSLQQLQKRFQSVQQRPLQGFKDNFGENANQSNNPNENLVTAAPGFISTTPIQQTRPEICVNSSSTKSSISSSAHGPADQGGTISMIALTQNRLHSARNQMTSIPSDLPAFPPRINNSSDGRNSRMTNFDQTNSRMTNCDGRNSRISITSSTHTFYDDHEGTGNDSEYYQDNILDDVQKVLLPMRDNGDREEDDAAGWDRDPGYGVCNYNDEDLDDDEEEEEDDEEISKNKRRRAINPSI